MSNTESIGYFTAFDANHEAPDIGTATPVKAEFVKRQLELTFNVPLKKATPLKGKTLRYAIYDNEFYIAMHHDPDNRSERLAFALMGIIGLMLIWRGVKGFGWFKKCNAHHVHPHSHQHAHHHDADGMCSACDHAHIPSGLAL